jgi:hypothetical protein
MDVAGRPISALLARPSRSFRQGHIRDRRFRCEQALSSLSPVEIVQIPLPLSPFAVVPFCLVAEALNAFDYIE